MSIRVKSVLAHPTGVYPSFLSMKQQGVLTLSPPPPAEWDVSLSQVNPPVFHQASLIICHYQFILLDGESGMASFKCFSPKSPVSARSVPLPLNLESTALTSRPLCIMVLLAM